MSFRSFKSKSKSTENNLGEITLTTLSNTETDDDLISDIEKLQNNIEYNEKSLNTFINHVLINLDANIDDIKFLIDQKRSIQKYYKLSICDLWFRLKTIEQMEPLSIINFLRKNQLHNLEINSLETNNNFNENEIFYLTNPRRSRLINFHIHTDSDEFNINISSYVGLLVFSYDNQSKFILNGHYCQRGDIIIKQIQFFTHTQAGHRGIYDALFKWYFGHIIDARFFGVGFLCLNGKWRFDLITYYDRDLFPHEYRIFDMFMLTHWLTQFISAKNIQEMEINAKDILLKQYDIVKNKLMYDNNKEILNKWNEINGNNEIDSQLCIEQFIQKIEKEIEIIFKQINTRTNSFSELFTKNV